MRLARMGLSHDVKMPRDVPARFPDRCVVCRDARPGHSMSVSSGVLGWRLLLFHFYGRFHVEVPVCRTCERAYRRAKLIRFAVMLPIVVAGVALAVWLFGAYRGPFRKWLLALIALVVMLPYCIWEVLNPLPFDITAYGQSVDYEFRDPLYAAEFAEENASEVT